MMSSAELAPGLPVESLDHRRIGNLAGVDDGRILVQPRFDDPYWLPDILVREAAPSGVTLHLDRRRIKRYRQPAEGQDRAGGGRLRALRVCAMAALSAIAWLTAFAG